MNLEARNLPIAVITVTYSPGEHLQPWLDSVRTASRSGVHIVLADNGSTDGVPQAAAAAPDVDFLETGGNVGYGAGMNAGVRSLEHLREQGAIDPDYFVISNPDVVFTPGSIDVLVDALQRHPRAGAVGPYIRQEDGSAYPSARHLPTLRNGIGHALFSGIWKNNPWTAAYKDATVMDQERIAGWLSGSCLLLRWEAFSVIGGFDERYFMYMEDVDLGDRLARAGYENVFCPDAVITHEVGHAAKKAPTKMLAAHHASAYRYQADRLRGWKNAPIRLVLRLGLQARLRVSVAVARFSAHRRSGGQK